MPTSPMPMIDLLRDPRPVFTKARRVSAGERAVPGSDLGQRSVVIVSPSRQIVPITCPMERKLPLVLMTAVRGVVPQLPRRAISVIASTEASALSLSVSQANEMIPFFGYLVGMVYDGHSVVVFEGHPSALALGCRGADFLLVDEAMIPHLAPDWATVAVSSLNSPRILMFTRDGKIVAIKSS